MCNHITDHLQIFALIHGSESMAYHTCCHENEIGIIHNFHTMLPKSGLIAETPHCFLYVMLINRQNIAENEAK